MRFTRVVAVALALQAAAMAFVRAYSVEPRTAAQSGKVFPSPGVSEVITCNFDSLSYVELFAGAKGSGGAYFVAVYDGNTPLMASYGDWVPDHGWVKFQNWGARVAFTKGKQYKFQFSRGSNDSIQYYWDEDPYQHGQLIVGQQEYPGRDLACLVVGRMRAVDSPDFGADAPFLTVSV